MRLRKRCIGILMSLFIVLTTSVYASNVIFSSNVEAINTAAQSVLMLEIYDSKDELIATGSGFVAFDNYTLITNEHVIENAELIIAHSDTGNQYMITKLIAADEKRDIAILEFFSPTDLIPLMLYDNNDIKRAEQIVAIGSPLGLKNAVSLGNISALYQDDGVSLIQFTAPISSGSSGGALFNDKGQVIGITSGSFTDGQNINLAVDISEVMNLYNATSMNDRIKVSKYSTQNVAQTSALAPESQEGHLDFSKSKNFAWLFFKNCEGYEYDKFDKTWIYADGVFFDENTAMLLTVSGDRSLNRPPRMVIINNLETKGGAFIKKVDVLVINKIYTYKNLRYWKDEKDAVFLYLGSIGRQMIEALSKTNTMSIRLTYQANKEETFDLDTEYFEVFLNWCKKIVETDLFECYIASDLIYADKVHEALIH